MLLLQFDVDRGALGVRGLSVLHLVDDELELVHIGRLRDFLLGVGQGQREL